MGKIRPSVESIEEAIRILKEYRSTHEAPVDKMGCESKGPMKLSKKQERVRILNSLILSSQTQDAKTYEAANNLEELYNWDTKKMSNASTNEIVKAIKMVGFANRKAIYIKKTALVCTERYNGDVPKTLEETLELSGVGPKMAYIFLSSALGQNIGIGVDTHVFRIADRLGWTLSNKSIKSKTPESTRKELQTLVPEKEWPYINKLLVGLGQTICTAKSPRCSECPLAKNHCKYAKNNYKF
ncbi:hypothetical protein BB560_005556 [Smittium megazygosporum]|uniref:DNA-(apurinic or apyrimidinic site) lyase n=1 Tax=Smittium megazygosporum TaxID=133381 RepID=A0A2T9Z3I2_9FUNG|nr:hypothetical protein BB560_005556 [Smittium megazygosporum]